MIRACSIALFLIQLQSCNDDECSSSIDLLKQVHSDSISSKSKLIVKYIGCDSVQLTFPEGVHYKSVLIFVESEGSFSENIYNYDFDGKLLGIEQIEALGTRDTTLIYQFDINKYPPVKPVGSDDFRRSIKKLSRGKYLSEKVSLADTTFTEQYYYDENYKLSEVVIRNRTGIFEFKSVRNK